MHFWKKGLFEAASKGQLTIWTLGEKREKELTVGPESGKPSGIDNYRKAEIKKPPKGYSNPLRGFTWPLITPPSHSSHQKVKGLVVDFTGLRGNHNNAMKKYSCAHGRQEENSH